MSVLGSDQYRPQNIKLGNATLIFGEDLNANNSALSFYNLDPDVPMDTDKVNWYFNDTIQMQISEDGIYIKDLTVDMVICDGNTLNVLQFPTATADQFSKLTGNVTYLLDEGLSTEETFEHSGLVIDAGSETWTDGTITSDTRRIIIPEDQTEPIYAYQGAPNPTTAVLHLKKNIIEVADVSQSYIKFSFGRDLANEQFINGGLKVYNGNVELYNDFGSFVTATDWTSLGYHLSARALISANDVYDITGTTGVAGGTARPWINYGFVASEWDDAGITAMSIVDGETAMTSKAIPIMWAAIRDILTNGL